MLFDAWTLCLILVLTLVMTCPTCSQPAAKQTTEKHNQNIYYTTKSNKKRKEEKIEKLRLFRKKTISKQLESAANNATSTSRPRLKGSAKAHFIKELQRQDRIQKYTDEFDTRLSTTSSEWIAKHPLAVKCKNSTQLVDYIHEISDVKVPCIPAIVLPIALDPFGFVSRLFASIDHCVSKLYIFKSDEVKLTESMGYLNRKLVHNVIIRKQHFPITLSHGWNMVCSYMYNMHDMLTCIIIETGLIMYLLCSCCQAIREMKNVSWYLFCANDVQFAPSQLAVLNRRFWMKSGLLHSTSNRDTSNNIDISYFNWKNMNPGGYNLFIMTRRVFDVVGMFDENMYPAFFEDADMDRRVELCKRMPNQR